MLGSIPVTPTDSTQPPPPPKKNSLAIEAVFLVTVNGMSELRGPGNAGVLRVTATAGDHGKRLDLFLAERFPDYSRAFWRRIIDLGGVHGAGRRLRRNSQAVVAGTAFEIYLDGREQELFILQPDHVLFQDPYLIVINKPAGVETQPTPARYQGTLYASLLDYLGRNKAPGRKAEVGMLQRLDRDTSGVLLFSLHPRSHGELARQFRERTIRKTYLALVAGGPTEPQGEYRSLLARERRSNRMKSVSAGGREAITRYQVVERFTDATLLEVEIPTGRSHQIRIHCAEAGHPLLGDRRYGGPDEWLGQPIQRQLLHARSLAFRHPVTREEKSVTAPLPADMLFWQERLRGSMVLPADNT